MDDILAQIRQENRFRKIAIHTIQLTGSKSRDWQGRLMRGLAEANGGTHATR